MMESDLFEICAQLQRDAGCRKVMVCGTVAATKGEMEGAILAHAGDRGILDEASSDALAAIVVDAMNAAAPPPDATPRHELPGELEARLPNGMTACATALADKAALVVVFDSATTLERVRIKMRRASERLVKTLPRVGDPTESNPSKS